MTTELNGATVGQQIAEWRQQRQWTIGQLSMASGVSKSSLSRWEAGLVQPRLRELDAVLDAFELTDAKRRLIYSRLGAVRATKRVAHATNATLTSKTTGLHPVLVLPRTGELLRALRIRRGLTQLDVAADLELHQSTVARWEMSVESPREEHFDALCRLLHVTSAERDALAQGPFIQPNSHGPISIEESQYRHHKLLSEAVFGTWVDADLAFLQLEADLWHLAQQHQAGFDLLLDVYGTHARFLAWGGRHAEAKRYIALLHEAMRDTALLKTGVPVPVQSAILLRASFPEPTSPTALKQSIHSLVQCHTRITEPEHRSWLFFLLAERHALLNKRDGAIQFCTNAMTISRDDGSPRNEEPAALLYRAVVSNKIRRYRQALNDVERINKTVLTPAQQTKAECVRATAYLGLGEKEAATEALAAGYRYVQQFGTITYTPMLDALAKRV